MPVASGRIKNTKRHTRTRTRRGKRKKQPAPMCNITRTSSSANASERPAMPPQPLQPLQPFKSTLRASSSEFEFSMVCPHHPAEAAAASRHQLTAGTEGGGGGGADERRRRKSYIDHSEELGDGVTRASLEELPGPEMEESNNLHLACEMLELQVRRVFFTSCFLRLSSIVCAPSALGGL